ncbi:MAG: O-antigen ligase family protein [Acidobacteria bacterium]|nr:O-antigen ligase family protein [Acidobacteriota bacterium]
MPPDAGRAGRIPLLLAAVCCALLTLAVLLPPEIDPLTRAACKVLLAGGACLLAAEAGEHTRFLPAWTWSLLPFAAVSIAAAPGRAGALDEASDACALVLAALAGRRLASESRVREVMIALIVTLACVAALRAVVQHHWIYPMEVRALRAGGGGDTALILARLEAGRPSGPFTLPAALGGFLAMTLPLTLALMKRAPGGAARSGILLASLVQGYALFLARSIGALAATAASMLLALPFLAPRRAAAGRWGVLVLAVAGTAFFLHARRVEIGSPGADPFVLRAGNWNAAVRMIRDHPLFGTGPGSFGTFYPRYIEPGMNETRYAHNSYLQVLAGWGVWAIVPLALFAGSFGARLRQAWRAGGADLPVLAAGAGFLAHNLVDFTAFLPGVALPAALLLGAGMGPRPAAGPGVADSRSAASHPNAGPRAARRAIAALTLALALGFSAHAVMAALSQDLLERAGTAAVGGDTNEALRLARAAARRRPGDPSPPAFIAEWVLAHGMKDGALREEGERAALRAAGLDPESAIRHFTVSLYHSAAGRPADAHRELLTARLLYPLKDLYRAGGRPGRTEAP